MGGARQVCPGQLVARTSGLGAARKPRHTLISSIAASNSASTSSEQKKRKRGLAKGTRITARMSTHLAITTANKFSLKGRPLKKVYVYIYTRQHASTDREYGSTLRRARERRPTPSARWPRRDPITQAGHVRLPQILRVIV